MSNHCRAGSERVLVSLNALDQAIGALEGSLNALEFFDIDEDLQHDVERITDRLRSLSHQKPHRPRAPKGHAVVPRELLQAAAYGLDEGAGEFEDAASYCHGEDITSCNSHASGLRHTAAQLRRYLR